MSDPNEVVGHKTMVDDKGQRRHEPLTRGEADAIMAQVEASEARRATAFPTPHDCARGLWDAWYRLKELGWKEPRYAPPDGRLKLTVSAGSSGIHKAYCQPRANSDNRHDKWWWHPDENGETWPHEPLLYYPDDQEQREEAERMVKAREMFARRHESLSSQ